LLIIICTHLLILFRSILFHSILFAWIRLDSLGFDFIRLHSITLDHPFFRFVSVYSTLRYSRLLSLTLFSFDFSSSFEFRSRLGFLLLWLPIIIFWMIRYWNTAKYHIDYKMKCIHLIYQCKRFDKISSINNIQKWGKLDILKRIEMDWE
jgi:hypothetical protein